MITRFSVSNYKALRDVTLDLTPVHLLIGPNDSGKTSILEAIGALCRSVDRPLQQAFEGSWSGRELVWQLASEPSVIFRADVSAPLDSFTYELGLRFALSERNVTVAHEVLTIDGNALPLQSQRHDRSAVERVGRGEDFGNVEIKKSSSQIAGVRDALRGVQYYRWVPRMLALPAAPDASHTFRMDSTGFGLARCLDDILGYSRERFGELESRFRQIFPDVETLRLKQEPAFRSQANPQFPIPLLNQADGKGIHVKFRNRQEDVPARQLSDGVLLILAYLAVLYLPQPPRVVLVEEPENGIHPSRLGEVLQVLRQLVAEQSHTQLILTTHSPYVVDYFAPEEVTLCHKQDDGSIQVRKLSESKAVREQIDVFTLGEIWTADGDAELLKAASDVAETSE